jgi:hypothetical protein
MFSNSLREIAQFDSSKLDLRTAFLCVPAIAAPLIVGSWFGQREGLVAAGGVMSVGFGSWQRISSSRTVPLLCASFGMAIAAALGTLVGNSWIAATLPPGPPVLIALVLLSALLCYTLLNVNYAAYAIAITAYVAFLLALVGFARGAGRARPRAEHRPGRPVRVPRAFPTASAAARPVMSAGKERRWGPCWT